MRRPILLFDGWCVLCSRSVRFLIKHEREPLFRFAPLDSEAGRLLSGVNRVDSIIVIPEDRKRYLVRGSAVLYILRYLNPPWSWLRIFGIIPAPVLDYFYDLIARRRYRLWGKYDRCTIPDELTRERLILTSDQAETEK